MIQNEEGRIPAPQTVKLDLSQPLQGTTEAYIVAVRARIYADYRDGSEVSGAMDRIVLDIIETHEADPLHLPGDVAQSLLEEVRERRRRQASAALAHSSLGGALGRAAPHVVAAMTDDDNADSDKPDEQGETTRTTRVRWMSKEERIARTHRLRLRRNKARKASIPPLIADAFGFAGQAVLGTIAWYCRRFGTCKLSVRSLAIKACCSERAVQYTLSEATKAGILRIQRRRWMTNVVSVASSAWRDWWNKPWLQKGAEPTPPGTSPVASSLTSFYDTPQGAKPCVSYPQGEASEEVAESPVEAREPLPAPEAARSLDPLRTAQPVDLSSFPDADPIPATPIGRVGCDHLFDRSKREGKEWVPPKPIAPVTPSSIGHGPKPVTVRQTIDAALNKIVDRFKAGIEATPTPIDPSKLVYGDRDPATDKVLDKLDEVVSEIAKTRVETKDPDAPLSEWEKPTPALHDTNGRRWLAEYGAVEELTPKRYPRVLEQGVMNRILGEGPEFKIRQKVLDWLHQNVGSAETTYSFRHLLFGSPEHGVSKLFIAFKQPQDSLAFRMSWGGGGPDPI